MTTLSFSQTFAVQVIKPFQSKLRSLLVLALLFVTLPDAWALRPTDDEGSPPPLECPGPDVAEVTVQLATPDHPLRGCRVKIEAGSLRLVTYDSVCDQEIFTPPADLPISWQLISFPAGTPPPLTASGTLAYLTLPRVGTYRVRLTVCSDGGCLVPLGSGAARRNYRIAQGVTVEAVINAVERISIPPEVFPKLPDSVVAQATSRTPFDPTELYCMCAAGGGAVDPQWVTVAGFDPDRQYAQIEGQVFKSWTATSDSFPNHDSMDINMGVEVDPPYRFRVAEQSEFAQPYLLGVEWERNSIPERFRPIVGDRVSVWGMWIHDCGHEPFYTEIHPAIGLAVMRPRALQLPSNRSFRFETPSGFVDSTVGNNVWIPGIVTDLWFNGDAGECTGNCSSTGLHTPARCIVNPQGQIVGFNNGDCVEGPHPINRFYSFNIYLPRNPRLIACEHGLDVPQPPLFIEVSNPWNSAGPAPQVRVATDDKGSTYLNVTLDLTQLTASTYSHRIRAGWVHTSPNNWNLQKRRVSITQLDVHDDLDPAYTYPYSDGDWGLWVELPTVDQEWTRLLDGEENAHGRMNFNPPWQTGSGDSLFWRNEGEVDPGRRLGPDLHFIEPHRIMGLSTAYESDGVLHDNPGRATFFLTPGAHSARSEKGAYTLHYTVTSLTPPTPALSVQARALFNRYQITCTNAFGRRPEVAFLNDPMSVNAMASTGVAEAPSWRAQGQPNGRFGAAMAGGDFDGDGVSDLFITEPGNGEGQPTPLLHFFRSQINLLSQSPTWTSTGPVAGIGFGRSMANAGDVNGDGLPDLIMGGPGYDFQSPIQIRSNTGAAYLWLGRSNLSAIRLTLTNTDWSLGLPNATAAEFGFSVASAGDVDHDGFGDVLVGAPGHSNGANQPRGRVFLYRGSATGLLRSAATVLLPIATSGSDPRFGESVAGLGDINGDGFGDVAIGAPHYQNGRFREGAVFVYLGSSTGLVATVHRMYESDSSGARLGAAVAAAGDVNGDRYQDLLVGAPDLGEDDVGGHFGAAYLFLGGPGGLSSTPSWVHYGSVGFANFGASLAGVGDLDRDGLSDVVIGAPFDFRMWLGEGTVSMFRGRATRAGLSLTPDWEQAGDREDVRLGSTVAGVGDVNHDGFPEFIYSALNWPSCDSVRGVAFLKYGKGPTSVRPNGLRFMRDVGVEEYALLNVSDPKFGDRLVKSGQNDPVKLERLLSEARTELNEQVMNTSLETEALLRLAPLQKLMPPAAWEAHLGDLVFDNGAAWFVNCGSTNEQRDALGRLWTPDTRYLVDTSAQLAVVAQAVDDSLLTDRYVPNEVLRSERWFGSNLRYAVPVPSGRYRAVLYFAETCLPCVGSAMGGTGCSACSRVFDLEFEGVRVTNVNPADRALGGLLDGKGATLKATEIVSAPFEVTDGVFDLTLFDKGNTNPPENPAIKGFVLMRLPPIGKTFNGPALSVATATLGNSSGSSSNLTLIADLKGNLALVQSGLGTVRLELSDDLRTWQPANSTPTLVSRAVRFVVPRAVTGRRFYRATLDLPGL
jgi:hypothetical protein